MRQEDETKAVLVLVDRDIDVVVGRIVAPHCDLALVEALARFQLQAGRDGHVVRLRQVSAPLCELLELVGLADLLIGNEPL